MNYGVTPTFEWNILDGLDLTSNSHNIFDMQKHKIHFYCSVTKYYVTQAYQIFYIHQMLRPNTKLELACFSQRLAGGKSGNSHCTTVTVMDSHRQPLLSHNLLPQFCSSNRFQAKFTLVFRK